MLTVAYGMLRSSVSWAHSSGEVLRRVKYIAKSPAKNITSLPSHTIVPTATGSGRLTERMA